MQRPRQFEKSAESEVWNAIDAFEQILEAMPDDRTALETLYEAYDHIGDKTHALEYLTKLAVQIAEEGDTDSVPWVYHSLLELGAEDPEGKKALQMMETLMSNMGLPSPAEMRPSAPKSNRSVDITSEMSLAWALKEAGELTEEDYSMVVKDLTENSTKHIEVPVSVLHALQDRSFKNLGNVIAFMARDTGLPVVDLSRFELDRDKFSMLTPDFTDIKGAMVFERIGREPLVAILNPYNEALKEEVRGTFPQGRCHFYLAAAADYDEFLQKAKVRPTPSMAGAA